MVNIYSIKLNAILKTATSSDGIMEALRTLDSTFQDDRILTVLSNFHRAYSLNAEEASLISGCLDSLK